MIITKTPFRISFLGGGTDYPKFFNEYGGSVISTTFDKYAYLTVRNLPHFFDFKTKIVYSKIETVTDINDIKHPLVRESMKYLNMKDLHISYDADLPAKSGLGSSSAFTCSIIQNFHAMQGKYISKKVLSEKAIYVERVLCGEDGGWQDQIASAYGGLNRINFKNNEFEVCPVIISDKRKKILNDHLMLFFTGLTRVSSQIAHEQNKIIKTKSDDLKEMLSLVDDGERILSSKCKIDEFGKLLDYTWKLKKSLTSTISSTKIDDIYERAIKSGAVGGKLLGAGGGGFILFFADPIYHKKIKETLSDLLYIPFKFNNSGSQILYYNAEDY